MRGWIMEGEKKGRGGEGRGMAERPSIHIFWLRRKSILYCFH